MSSVYGPALLKPASFEENTEFSGGKTKANKENGNQFETDADRAKRIRKERKALKAKDKETSQKLNMGQAISAVLGRSSSASAGFVSFGPADPAAAPPGGHAAGPAGPAGPPTGPAVGPTVANSAAGPPVARPGTASPGSSNAGGAAEASAVVDSSASAAAGPAPRPRGPARPPPEVLPRQSAEAVVEEVPTAPSAEPLRPFDHLATQKRVSWDELKERLANAELRQEGVPGSKSFDDYSEKLEKNRNERLQKQEMETKKLLKRAAGVSEKKMKKIRKEMKEKANSDDSSSGQEDALLARYKQR